MSTRGIIFFGTPNTGSSLAHWAEALARFIGFIKPTNLNILSVLRHDSEVLATIQDDFHRLIAQQYLHIACFSEELPLPNIGLVSAG